MARGGGAGRGIAAKVPPKEGTGAAWAVSECVQVSVQAACEELKAEQNDICLICLRMGKTRVDDFMLSKGGRGQTPH